MSSKAVKALTFRNRNYANPHHGSLPPFNGVDLRAWHTFLKTHFFLFLLLGWLKNNPPITH